MLLEQTEQQPFTNIKFKTHTVCTYVWNFFNFKSLTLFLHFSVAYDMDFNAHLMHLRLENFFFFF